MPGAAVMSKLASSSTMMMCGRLPAGWQLPLATVFSRSATVGSLSSQPRVASSDTDITPERAKFERWLTPWNGSHGSSGTALDRPISPTRQAVLPRQAVVRRMRNGSRRHSRASAGIASSAAIMRLVRNAG